MSTASGCLDCSTGSRSACAPAHEIAVALDAGEPPAQIKRRLRMPSRAADKLIADARGAGSERLRLAICEIADLELASRGGGSGGAGEDTAALLAIAADRRLTQAQASCCGSRARSRRSRRGSRPASSPAASSWAASAAPGSAVARGGRNACRFAGRAVPPPTAGTSSEREPRAPPIRSTRAPSTRPSTLPRKDAAWSPRALSALSGLRV